MYDVSNKFFSGLSFSKEIVINEIHNTTKHDIDPSHNLGSFTTTRMDCKIHTLLSHFQKFNAVNKNEYPSLTKISEECSNILARLFNIDFNETSVGINTVGSSEAVALACLNLKLLWIHGQNEGKNYRKPNILIGENAHLSWKKFAEYFEIEPRIVKTTNLFLIESEDIFTQLDENTIGICVTLGTTYTGGFDPIEEISNKLITYNRQKGTRSFIHVDAASGGFIAPFEFPKMKWDFRLPNVISINVSSHKYGFTYPSLGWLIIRDKKYLAKELSKTVHYLSGEFPLYNFNFTMSAAPLIAQYYNFLTLGKNGYSNIVNNIFKIRKSIIKALKSLPFTTILEHDLGLPVIIFYIKEGEQYITEMLACELRKCGWSLPVYQLPGASSYIIARIVVRREMTNLLAEELIKDLTNAVTAISSVNETT